MEGMLTKELSSLDASLDAQDDCTIEVSCWFKGLVKRLLEISHGLWIYRDLALHDDNSSILLTQHQERLLKGIENQLHQGQEGLREEDQWMLEIDMDTLTGPGGRDIYWLLVIQTARDHYCINRGWQQLKHEKDK
jgi:hypothetical protein